MSHYPDANSASARLYERACAVIPGGISRLTIHQMPYPVYASRGRGARIVDVDGVERIDFFNNATSLQHGHSHPAIVAVIAEQLGRLTAAGMTTEAEVLLAELLCKRVSSVDQIRFTNTGSEATYQAIRAARAFTGRMRIAKCEGGYHGAYDYVEASLSPTPEEWGEPYPTPVPYGRGTPQSALDEVIVFPFNDVRAITDILLPKASEIAAVIVDPFPAALGFPEAREGYLAALRSFTEQHCIVLIFDEVISFRLSRGGAQPVLGVMSDLTAFGKVIGGGLPVGAVGGRKEIMAVFDARNGKPGLPHAGTFNANPLTMTAGRAALELMTPDEYARVDSLGDRARSALVSAASVAGVPCQVTGAGSLLMFHLHHRPIVDYRSYHRSPDERAAHEQLHRYLLNHGIFTGQLGLASISTAMTPDDVDRFAEVFLEALRQINWESPAKAVA